MARLLIGILIGLIVGGVLTFYFFVGVPKAGQAPGTPIQPPSAEGPPAGGAQIVLRQDFFNEVLGTIFRDMSPPSFPLGSDPGQVPAPDTCGMITILPEGSGVRTGLKFENNRIAAPLAFTGSYASPFGCYQFTGWAQANLDLRYDQAQQMVFGQVNVETVNLDGLNPVVSVLVTPIVQSTLNTRVNPIQILDGKQIAVNMPIAATNGNLQANVSDVRAEVKDNALHLYVIYGFQGAPLQQPQAVPTP